MSKESNPKNLPTLHAPETTIRLLEYLKKYTDKEHPFKSIRDAKKVFEKDGLNLGSDNTIRKYYREIVNAYNLDQEQHPLPQEKWRIVYDGYAKRYGDAEDGDAIFVEDDDNETGSEREQFKNLYYVPELSYEDIDMLIEALQASRTLTMEETDRLISILEDKCTSIHYKERRKSARGICKIYEKECYDRNLLRENLLTIQQAIEDDVQIAYRFNGYTRDKKLAPMGDYERRGISPYYIVTDNGRYYLMAANDKHKNESPFIIRIDLMTDVTIPERNDALGIPGIPRIPKRDVAGLPQEWDENFPVRHINMSYDDPILITLRIKNEKGRDGCTPISPVYAFLYDYFGDTYRYVGVDKEDADYDIVKVRCSGYGMENFALQYADRLEVLEPPALREKITAKVQTLAKRYSQKGANA